MKTLPILLLFLAGVSLLPAADKPAAAPWLNSSWNEDTTLSLGSYYGTGRKIEIAQGKKIVVSPGCLVDKAVFTGAKDVDWNVRGSFLRNTHVDFDLGGKFDAADSLFENPEMKKSGSRVTDLWCTHWKWENCAIAGTLLPADLMVKHYSIRAGHCTFYDLLLPRLTYRHDPAAEAQSEELKFNNCRFVRCEIPESLLAATVDCVFEDCRFPGKREDWKAATKPIVVTAWIAGRAAPPQNYENGNLKVTFKSGNGPANGCTLPCTYANGHLSSPAIHPPSPAVPLGGLDQNPVAGEAPGRPEPPAAGSTRLSPADKAVFGELVKNNHDNLVVVTGSNGSGSGFVAELNGANFVFTNAHVAAGVKSAEFKKLDGSKVDASAPFAAVDHDIFRLTAPAGGKPFEIMDHVEGTAAIGDAVVVLGNAEGAGVINTIKGTIVGIGPNLVEVDAPFVPGNSGSPIIHVSSGKVIGVATYALIKRYDPETMRKPGTPTIRRFGYRLDSVKTWQPVNWNAFAAQAVEMETIEQLTNDLGRLLTDVATHHKITPGAHTNPALKGPIDLWTRDQGHQLSPSDKAMAQQNFVSRLKSACQGDVTAARARLTYDYFVRKLSNEQRDRDSISDAVTRVFGFVAER